MVMSRCHEKVRNAGDLTSTLGVMLGKRSAGPRLRRWPNPAASAENVASQEEPYAEMEIWTGHGSAQRVHVRLFDVHQTLVFVFREGSYR